MHDIDSEHIRFDVSLPAVIFLVLSKIIHLSILLRVQAMFLIGTGYVKYIKKFNFLLRELFLYLNFKFFVYFRDKKCFLRGTEFIFIG